MSPEVADLLIAFARSDEGRLEEIGEALQAAPVAEQEAFLNRVRDRAGCVDGEERAFLEELPDHLGLSEES